jgi:hypothetical protein
LIEAHQLERLLDGLSDQRLRGSALAAIQLQALSR